MIVPFLDFQNNADSGINFHLVSKTITQEYTPKWIPRNISRVPSSLVKYIGYRSALVPSFGVSQWP